MVEADPSKSGRRCPTCGKPPVVRYRPFCSKRCADLDLGRWLDGRYRIPSVDDDNDGDNEQIPSES